MAEVRVDGVDAVLGYIRPARRHRHPAFLARAAHLGVAPDHTVLSKGSECEGSQLRPRRGAGVVPGLSAADHADSHGGRSDSVDQVGRVGCAVGRSMCRSRSGVLTDGAWAKDGGVRWHHSLRLGRASHAAFPTPPRPPRPAPGVPPCPWPPPPPPRPAPGTDPCGRLDAQVCMIGIYGRGRVPVVIVSPSPRRGSSASL